MCNGSRLYTEHACAQTCREQANATGWREYSSDILKRTPSCRQCKNWEGTDPLLEAILRNHDGLPLNRALDAGTGATSLNWLIRELRPKKWTAVTAAASTLKLLSTPVLEKRIR